MVQVRPRVGLARACNGWATRDRIGGLAPIGRTPYL